MDKALVEQLTALRAAGFSAADALAAVTATVTTVPTVATPAPAKAALPVCKADGCKAKARAQGKRLCAKHFADSEARAQSRAKAWAEKAPERAARKGDNRALAAALRAVGVAPTGDTWAQAKALVAAGSTPEQATALVAKK